VLAGFFLSGWMDLIEALRRPKAFTLRLLKLICLANRHGSHALAPLFARSRGVT